MSPLMMVAHFALTIAVFIGSTVAFYSLGEWLLPREQGNQSIPQATDQPSEASASPPGTDK